MTTPSAEKPPKEPNYVSAFDLSNSGTDADPVFQFVYGSQLYLSLFGIYGRFNSTITGDECIIRGINLELLNYQGVVNIGFTPDEPKPRHYPPFYKVEKVNNVSEARLYFGVTAMSMIRKKTVAFNPELVVRKGERFTITFCRICEPLDGFGSTGRDVTEPNGTVPDTPYFDTEFNARSGVDYFQNPLRPGMAGHGALTLQSLHQKTSWFGSPRCSQSIVKLYF